MSDYLAGLATRVLAPGSVLQPRMPSRFEAAAAEDEIAPAAFDAPAPARTQAAAPAAAHDPVIRIERVPEPHTRIIRSKEAIPAPERVPAERISEHAPPPRTVERIESAPEAPVHEEASSPRPVVRIERHTRTERIETPIERTAVTPHEPETIPRTVLRERRVPPQRIERLRVRREESIVERGAAPPPVEITIGRVDVRAVVSAQPPAPPPGPKTQVRTLDEYAAAREGRNR